MTTEERLDKLEKELARAKRRNRRLLVLAGLAAGAFALVRIAAAAANKVEAQGDGVATVIRANAFVLVDENGKTRAAVALSKTGSGFLLYDENGKTRAVLAVDKDGPGLALADEDGKSRATLAVVKDGPGLVLYDKNGKAEWQAP